MSIILIIIFWLLAVFLGIKTIQHAINKGV